MRDATRRHNTVQVGPQMEQVRCKRAISALEEPLAETWIGAELGDARSSCVRSAPVRLLLACGSGRMTCEMSSFFFAVVNFVHFLAALLRFFL